MDVVTIPVNMEARAPTELTATCVPVLQVTSTYYIALLANAWAAL
jgi:hypothetical protein